MLQGHRLSYHPHSVSPWKHRNGLVGGWGAQMPRIPDPGGIPFTSTIEGVLMPTFQVGPPPFCPPIPSSVTPIEWDSFRVTRMGDRGLGPGPFLSIPRPQEWSPSDIQPTLHHGPSTQSGRPPSPSGRTPSPTYPARLGLALAVPLAPHPSSKQAVGIRGLWECSACGMWVGS